MHYTTYTAEVKLTCDLVCEHSYDSMTASIIFAAKTLSAIIHRGPLDANDE